MADLRQDLKQIDNDIVFENNDLAIDYSDNQHIQDTINAFQGWWKEYPADGVGIQAYLNAPLTELLLKQNIRSQLESDGYKANPIIYQDYKGTTNIDPQAENNY